MPVRIHVPDLHGPKRELDFATRSIARAAGRIVRDAIREKIPDGSGVVSPWPSCLATGALKSAVVAQEPVKRGGKWHLRIGIQRRRRAGRYARIHEYGGVIRPRGKPFLVFIIPPQCVKSMPSRRNHKQRKPNSQGNQVIPLDDGSLLVLAKQVRIRPKRYFQHGWQEGRRRIQTQLNIYVRGHGIR